MKIAIFLVFFLSQRAHAAETPRLCGPGPRERCIDYRPGQIVSLILAPGATMTIQLPQTETVFFVGTSDDGIIRGDGATVRTATAGDTTADPNLMISVPGGIEHPTQFLTLKALHHLEPQPFLVIGRYTHPLTGEQAFRRHVFELQTRPGDPMGEALDTIYSVLFADPVGEKEVRAAMWKAQKEQREAEIAADRLKQVNLSTLQRNTAYEGQGRTPTGPRWLPPRRRDRMRCGMMVSAPSCAIPATGGCRMPGKSCRTARKAWWVKPQRPILPTKETC